MHGCNPGTQTLWFHVVIVRCYAMALRSCRNPSLNVLCLQAMKSLFPPVTK